MSAFSGIDPNDGMVPIEASDSLQEGVTRPLLVSPSVEPLPGVPLGPTIPLVFTGQRWPGLAGQGWARMPEAPFREEEWDAYRYGIGLLTEFVQIPGTGGRPAWETLLTAADKPDLSKTDAELKELRDLVEYRAGVMAEALAQRSSFIGYFAGILDFDLTAYRNTFLLCEAMMSVGQFLAVRWKREWKRARPSRLDPALVPPIAVPGHAAYPSGHATQALLMALVLEQVLPLNIVQPPPSMQFQADRGPLRAMARRIARNREVLGLHYPSDSVIGQILAVRALPLLLGCPTIQGSTGTLPLRLVDPVTYRGGSIAVPLQGVTACADGLLAKARAEWV
jgi:hypothetical protein